MEFFANATVHINIVQRQVLSELESFPEEIQEPGENLTFAIQLLNSRNEALEDPEANVRIIKTVRVCKTC